MKSLISHDRHKISSNNGIDASFQLCPEEVDAAAWLSVDLIKHIVWNKDQLDKAGMQDNNDTISITLVNQEGGKSNPLLHHSRMSPHTRCVYL